MDIKKYQAMNKNYLLPYRFKKIGIWMFFPFCAICIWLLAFDGMDKGWLKWPALSIFPDGVSTGWFSVIENDPVDEIAMLGLLVSLCFIALSREKDEDEMTGYVRMQSFVWSLWVTAAILALGILFIYGLLFAYFAFVAVFLVFVVYILKFNLTMHAARRADK